MRTSRVYKSVLLVVQSLCGSVALADFNYPDFNSTAGVNLIGATQQSGGRLRLTTSTPETLGAAWVGTKQPVAGGFETIFHFEITLQGGTTIEPGADGFAFVVQSSGTAAIGSFGGAIGYDGFPGVAVEFDTFMNPENNDPNNNHISVHTAYGQANSQDHVFSLGQATAIGNMSDGQVHTVKIVYTPGILDIYLDNLTTPALSVSVNIATALSLPGNDAYVGFTSATGLAFEVHDILDWSYDGCGDSDGDEICDDDDNCPDDANPGQADSDSDGFGDACDNCPGFDDLLDNDGDGAPDGCDNCPTIPNPNQEDTDNDDIGDCCDADLGDADVDGVSDPCDNCPENTNPDQADADLDGIGDVCDPCFNPPAQDDRTWIAGSSNWSNSAAWSPAGVPDTLAEAAFVAGGGALTIGLDISPTIQTLVIGNAAAMLNLGGQALTLARCDGLDNSGTIVANTGAGSAIHGYIFNRPGGLISIANVQSLLLTGSGIVNDGTIALGTGASASATLTIGADASLSGTGDIVMPNSASTLATADPFLLTQEAGHLIHGRGHVTGSLLNLGTVRADADGQVIFLNTKDKSNQGTLEAIAGSRMEIDAITIHNTGGTIVGNGGEIDLDPDTLIVGGTLNSAGDGLVLGRGGSVQDITNQGLFRVLSVNSMSVLGSSLANEGTIEVGGGASAATTLSFDANVSVSGPGEISMRDSGATIATTDAFVVTNEADHLIHGRGVITGNLINHGTIEADLSGQFLRLNTNPKTNDGVIRALAGSQVEIETVTVSNDGGTLLGNEGVVNLELGATIVGGTLDTVGGGLILGEGDSVLENVTNAGLFRVASVHSNSVTGSSLTNQGTIEIGGGVSAATILGFDANVSVDGPGDIFMRDSGATIATTDAFVVTNEADHLIHGRGVITGNLVNHGTIRADLNSQVLRLSTNPKTNDSTIEALTGSQLEIEAITVNNAGGTLLGNEGVVNLELGATIVGGTLDTVGGGLILGESDSVLENVTNAGLFRVASVHSNSVTGSSLTNAGTIEIGGGVSAATILSFDSNVSVSGPGEIFMRDSGATIATTDAFVVTNEADHLIHGRGVITGKLVNHGTIRADLSGQVLRLSTNPKTNDSTIEAVTGSQLEIEAITLDNAGGTLLGNEGVVNLELGATVVGGTLNSSGDGYVLGEQSSTLQGVTNLGRYLVESVHTNLVGGPALINHGTLYVGRNVGATTTLKCISDVAVSGSGEILLQDSNATVSTDTGVQMTNGAGHRIRGRGRISADLINRGTIICDGGAMTINPAGAGVSNQGEIHVIAGGAVNINTATLFTTSGQVTLDAGVGLTVNGGNYTQTAGVTTVEGSLTLTGGEVVVQGGELKGNGTVNGGVTNTAGLTSPGASAGKLTITGDYTQNSQGVLKIEIGGLTPVTEHDVLALSGAATLAGELNVVPTGGFIPQIGQQFVILTANSVLQTFDEVTGPGSYTVQYNPGNVTLTVTQVPCNGFSPADFDQDCDVDQEDIAAFAACASGPAIAVPTGCEAKDFDDDNDADDSDFGIMQRCLSGTNMPADPDCLD